MNVRRPSLIAAAVPPRATGVAALAVAGVGVAGVTGVMVGIAALAAFVIVGQGLLAWWWTRWQQASAGTAVIIAVASAACDVTLLARKNTEIGDLAGVVGAGVVVVVVYQLARRRVRATGGPNAARQPSCAEGSATDPTRIPERGVPGHSRRDGVGAGVPGHSPRSDGLGADGLADGLGADLGGPECRYPRVTAEAAHPGAARDVRTGSGEPARVTVDMAAGLSGVGLVALLAAVLALDVQDGGAGAALAAAGLLGVGVGVGVSRLVSVTMAVRRAGDSRAEVAGAVGAAVGVVTGAAAGAALGVLAGISFSEGAAVAVAGAAAALAVEAGFARGLLIRGGVGEVPAGAPPGPAPLSAGPVPPPVRVSVPVALAALLPFAMATPVVYLAGRLFLP